jgi:glycosyltransferase involved in cell wall biosynthesis
LKTGPTYRVLFHRRLVSPTAGINGGNLKLRDCYNHVAGADDLTAAIYFSPETVWNEHRGNHWSDLRTQGLSKWEIVENDILFFAGGDWRVLPEEQRHHPPVPVINIAHPRHTRPEDPRNEFLQHPAIRIAKSENGARILRDYGVNGPVFVIPDGIDLGLLPPVPAEKDIDLLVIGRKEPALAKRIYRKLQWNNRWKRRRLNIQVQLPPPLPTRNDFLQLLSRAKIALCLPLQADRGFEGFYLPALEAMALKTLVICPHVVGNLGHCIDDYNCLVPRYQASDLLKGVRKMLVLDEVKKQTLVRNGLATAEKHRIENERTAILELLRKAPDLWNRPELFNMPN